MAASRIAQTSAEKEREPLKLNSKKKLTTTTKKKYKLNKRKSLQVDMGTATIFKDYLKNRKLRMRILKERFDCVKLDKM